LVEQLVVLQFQLLFDLNDNWHKLIFHLPHEGLNNFAVQKLDMLMNFEQKIQKHLQQS
jgi:hypothetical protein